MHALWPVAQHDHCLFIMWSKPDPDEKCSSSPEHYPAAAAANSLALPILEATDFKTCVKYRRSSGETCVPALQPGDKLLPRAGG